MSRSKKLPWSVWSAAAFTILALLLISSLGTAQQRGDPNLWAGIEIGATGVKVVILNTEAKLIAAADRPGNITVNLKKGENGTEFAEDAITRTIEAVRQLRDLAKEKHNVPDNQIFVVASSGVNDLKAKNWGTLAAKVSELFKDEKRLDAIDVTQETAYTFLAVVPPEDYGNAIYIDIGGSNTKFGYVTKDGSQYIEPVPFGSSTLLTGIPADADLVKEVERRRGRVTEALRNAIAKLQKNAKAKLQVRPNVYLGGGASWAMAMLEGVWDGESPQGPGPGKPVEITPDKADKTDKIVRFGTRVRDRQHDPYQLTGKEPTPAQKKEIQNVKKVFPPPRLVAAAAMLEAVSEAFDFKNGRKEVNHLYFTPNSHLAWIHGYVKAQMPKRPDAAKPLTREEFTREIEAIKKELKELRGHNQSGDQDARLRIISEAVATLSEHMKALASRPAVPPPAVDLTPLVEELQKIRKGLPKGTTPPPEGTGLQPAPSPNRGAAAQHFARGVEFYLGWRFEQALIHFDAASRADARDPSHWYGLILTQHRLGLNEFARVSARRVAAVYRNDPRADASVAIAFERIQGSDRTTADAYVRQALNDLNLGRTAPTYLSSAGSRPPGDRAAPSGSNRITWR